jgi:hypothetical protein
MGLDGNAQAIRKGSGGKEERTLRKTIAVDFDGVIHTYDRGWHDGTIYGEVMPGFREWLNRLPSEHFLVVVHTSRDEDEVKLWLHGKGISLPVSNRKPPAWVVIDDRAIRFDGHWDDARLSVQSLHGFLPWNVRKKEDENDGE